MAMITKIISDFNSKSSFSTSDEVCLFRALARAIENYSSSTFIDETHGGKVCNVSFTSTTGKPEICEIADLLVISISIQGPLRATFWQVKKQGASKWLNSTSSVHQLDFKGQFNQWDLLSRRPSISGVDSFRPPSDLLSSFRSPSIGSFGVFYPKGAKTEVAYSIAEFVSCANPTAKHPTLSVNGYLSKYTFPQDEVISRGDLSAFLRALFAFQVGALLDSSEATHRWLVRWVRSKAVQAGSPSALLHVLGQFLEQDGYEDIQDVVLLPEGLSILIVRTLDQE